MENKINENRVISMAKRDSFNKFLGIALILFFGLFGLAKISWAATYYIDYATGADTNNGTSKSTPWKLHPYMPGFNGSYSHVPGDVFVFKGGVTWPATTMPLTIAASGSAGNIDTYTVEQTWYSGGAWSQPIFDGNNSLGRNSFLIGDNYQPQSYLLFDNLHLKNCGADDGSGTALSFGGGSHIEVRNMLLEPDAVGAFSYGVGSGSASDISFHDSHVRLAGRSVVFGASGAVVDNVKIYNNLMEGPGDAGTGTFHADGFMIGNPATAECAANGVATVTNIQFYNNKFYGDWHTGGTAHIYSNGCTDGVTIYNNVFSYENTGCSGYLLAPGLVVLYSKDNHIKIYNNTFSNDACNGYGDGAEYAIFVNNPAGNGVIDIKGNILSGFGNAISYNNTTNVSIDYNLYYGPNLVRLIGDGSTPSWECHTLADCHARNFELNSPAVSDPKYVSPPSGTTGSGNWYLQSGSPAINALPTGQAPTGIFTTDISGASRPQGSAWDIGAYEYAPGGDTTPPAAPTGLSVR